MALIHHDSGRGPDANRDKRERLNMGVSSRQEVLDIVYDAGAEGETTPAS